MKIMSVVKDNRRIPVIGVILLAVLTMSGGVASSDDCSQQYDDCCDIKVGWSEMPKITCGWIFSDSWCAKPGYLGCAEGAVEVYKTCLKTRGHMTCDKELDAKIYECRGAADAAINKCKGFCSQAGDHLTWDGKSKWPDCQCACKKGYGLKDGKCVKCEGWCQEMGAHYDSIKSKQDECECKCDGKLMRFVWGTEKGECECVPGAVPKGNECECPEGWEPGVRGDKCVEKVKEPAEKSAIDKEKERIANKYKKLKKGHLLYSEGMVTKRGARILTGSVVSKPDYGHVGIYIGDFEATKHYKVLDEAQLPLKVFRNGEAIELTKVGMLIKPGDQLIGCVVEARWNGIVFNTVDGMEAEAERTMGRKPKFAWKTTNPPPDEEEVQGIVDFALEKINLSQQGKAAYFPGKQGTTSFDFTTTFHNATAAAVNFVRGYPAGIELWDCVSLAEAAYETVGLNPTPDHLDSRVSIQPQEQYDNIAKPKGPTPIEILSVIVKSPVQLHLYDSHQRHVGFTSGGDFERDIPNAYYYLEWKGGPQAIVVQNVDDEYTLVMEALESGSFDLEIQDLNVSRPDNLTKVEFLGVSITKSTIASVRLGADNESHQMIIDDDGDGESDRTLDPTSLEVSPVDSKTGDVTGSTLESRGSEVQIPLQGEEDLDPGGTSTPSPTATPHQQGWESLGGADSVIPSRQSPDQPLHDSGRLTRPGQAHQKGGWEAIEPERNDFEPDSSRGRDSLGSDQGF